VAGVASVRCPLLDNTSMASVDLLVAPGARRRGVGSALLAAVESALGERGRTILLAETMVALPGAGTPADGGVTAPGAAFATAHGFSRAHSETHFVLELPPPAGHLDRLEAHAASAVADYRLVSWVDRAPDRWVAGMCDLEEAFLDEAPTGDLELEAERWSEQRLRGAEERRRARGQHVFVTAVVAPDGRLVGNTELILAPSMVRRGAMQNGTLVLPEHRGHRLGLAAKVENLRRLLAFDAEPRLLHTFNAGVNAPMLAVNAQLGFRPVEVLDEWQRRLDGPAG